MGAADRLRDDAVYDAEPEKVLVVIFMLVAASCAREESRHRIDAEASGEATVLDRVLEHQHLVRGSDGDRPAKAALADHHGDVGRAEREARVDRARDRLGLAALLRLDAGTVGGVDERDHRQVEPVGELDQADCLAIAFRPGHAEIVLEPAFGVVALLLADDADRLALEPAEARARAVAASSSPK